MRVETSWPLGGRAPRGTFRPGVSPGAGRAQRPRRRTACRPRWHAGAASRPPASARPRTASPRAKNVSPAVARVRAAPGSPVIGHLVRVVACESMIRAWRADPGPSVNGALSSSRRVEHEGRRSPVSSCRPMACTALTEGRTGGAGLPTRARARPGDRPTPWTHESSTQRQRTAPWRGHPAQRRLPKGAPRADDPRSRDGRPGDQRWPRCPALAG